jgi:CubicO group peptidase (beta-lactamase class C family)
MRPTRLILFATVLIAQACRQSSMPGLRDADEIARREYIGRHLPGMSVVILKGDETLFAQGYGAADIAGAVPILPSTIFQLGSIGKQFLAALVVALAADGALSLDAPVVQHLPDFTLLPPGVAVRHLLNHTSGIRELLTLPEAQEGFDNLSRTRDELVAVIRKAPVDFPPGSRWSYSNTNYTMLALIVERITGRPYEDVLADRFFRPFELKSMRQCASIPSGSEARGYEWKNNMNVLAAPENMNWIRGDGGLCGNATDLARWTRLLSTGRVVPRDAYETMIAPTRLTDGSDADYGFALSLARPDYATKIAHNGAMRGFSASTAYYPVTETTTVVLINRGNVRTEAIERAVARRVIGEPEQNRTARQLPPDERQRVIGTYNIGVFDTRVVDRDGQLWFEAPPPVPTFRLRYIGGGRFVNDADPDATALYFTDDDRPAQRMKLYMGGMNWPARRVNP